MAAIKKSTRVCETCGASTDVTSSGDLGCVACLLDIGLGPEMAGQDGALASAPDRLGAYTIEHHADGSAWELGHGAMGVTYRAIDKALDRAVALKIINTDLVSHGAKARERFMREARAAAALRHPNVATVYQFGVREETGQFFYAMGVGRGRNAGRMRPSPRSPRCFNHNRHRLAGDLCACCGRRNTAWSIAISSPAI
jgi:hypothetical protein